MKALRYILSLITILSVVSVAAATFGKPYQPQGHGVQYASSYTQMPTLPMSSTGSAMMKSGSALPMAAVSGTTTSDDYTPARSSRPRRVEGSGTEDGDADPDAPGEPNPLGDAILPMLLCAAVFCGAIAIRRKRSAIKGEG
jgi:hypothetical protein